MIKMLVKILDWIPLVIVLGLVYDIIRQGLMKNEMTLRTWIEIGMLSVIALLTTFNTIS